MLETAALDTAALDTAALDTAALDTVALDSVDELLASMDVEDRTCRLLETRLSLLVAALESVPLDALLVE